MSFATPITYPVTHYQSSDKDAPQYRGEVGDVLTIIKACLVTGYGDQPSAGWQALYEEAGKITLKRPATVGSHYVLQIHDNSTACTIRVQEHPSNIDDTQKLNANERLGARMANVNRLIYAPRWHLIACERAFLLYIETSEAFSYSKPQNGMCYYFGDMMSDDQRPYCAVHYPIGNGDGTTTIWYFALERRMEFFPTASMKREYYDHGTPPNALILIPSLYYGYNAQNPYLIAIAPWLSVVLPVVAGREQYGQTRQHINNRDYLLLLNCGYQLHHYYSSWIAVPLDEWSF